MIKRYSQFIKEANDNDLGSGEQPIEEESNPNKYSEVKEEIKSMINKTIEKSGGEFDSFVDSLIKNPTDTKIEGLINDSDVYDFYLKFRGEVDEMLSDIKFYDEIPSEINAFGLYDYIIKGTQKSIEEFLKQLK